VVANVEWATKTGFSCLLIGSAHFVRQQFGFLHAREMPIPTWWRLLPCELPILVGWAGGTHAAKLSNRPQQWVLQRAIECVATILGLRSLYVESVGGHAGIVHGAIETGECAAKEILRSLGRR
jgi:hypothetical protein